MLDRITVGPVQASRRGKARGAVEVRVMPSDMVEAARARHEAPASFRGEPGEVAALAEGTVVAGIGRRDELRPAALRTCGGRVVRLLERLGAKDATIAGLESLPRSVGSPRGAGQSFAEGVALGNWRFDEFDGTASSRSAAGGRLALAARDSEVLAGLERGLLLGRAANESRRISATPPNVADPEWIAGDARRLARRHGLRCRVIDFSEAKRLGMGGLVNVGKGSESKPRLVLLEHRPKRVAAAARGVRLALVGKTITYDTGGYSLKVNNGMRGMKYDKCGGAAVIGAMVAIAEAKLPVEVVALLPAAENMVSGVSYRPDDIISMHNGVTVEVTNTDAEGRLVLADALSFACATLKPTAIVDVATLTGGVVVALGAFSAGLFCNDDALRARVETASERTGEKVWRFPLWPEHREFMRSQHADILNSNPKREAHPIQGAAFLSYFVDPKVPWAHLDIAGVNAIEGANDLLAAGPTGWGVRLLFELASGFAGLSSE